MQRLVPSEFSRKDGSINVEKAIEAGHEARSAALQEVATEMRNRIRAVGTTLMTGGKA